MATSKTTICNLALTHLGVKNVSALTDANEAARKLTLIYDVERDEVLRAHNWNFATKAEALALLSEVTYPGFEYVYTYPATCLFIRRLMDEDGNDRSAMNKPYPFKEIIATGNIKGIASNLEDAYAEYTFQVIDTSFYDPIFIKALSHKLAASLAIPLTGKADLQQDQMKLYMAALEEAKRVNRTEVNSQDQQTSDYVTGR